MKVRINARHLGGAFILSVSSFLFGFASSRFVIDLSLRQADAVLLRSADEFERQQTILMRQFDADYQVLEGKLNAIRPRRGKYR
ncbi:MAG: hypothetical protein ACR2JB_13310 [Bryobacteraceae bacterium]